MLQPCIGFPLTDIMKPQCVLSEAGADLDAHDTVVRWPDGPCRTKEQQMQRPSDMLATAEGCGAPVVIGVMPKEGWR